jgi:general secretion pathway protein E
MAKLDIAEKRLPQDGSIKIKIAGKDIDIRLSTVPVQNGERIVMRVLEKTNTVLELGNWVSKEKFFKNLKEVINKKARSSLCYRTYWSRKNNNSICCLR